MIFYEIDANIFKNEEKLDYVDEYMFRANACQARTVSILTSLLVRMTILMRFIKLCHMTREASIKNLHQFYGISFSNTKVGSK